MRICTIVNLRFKKRKFRILGIGTALLCSYLLMGCEKQQTEEENLVLIERSPESIEYTLGVATVGDVVKIKTLRCDYEELNGMDLSFPVSGKTVEKVHVKVGEKVTKGQLLAELSIGNVEEKVRDLEYKIARNSLLLEYVDVNENYEISSMWHKYIYESSHSDDKANAVADSVERLQQKNEYTREDYRDAIEMDTLELADIQAKIAQCYLYAGMDGTVSYLKSGLEGTVSKEGDKIISIIDGTDGLFVVKDVEYAPYFKEGEEVEMTIISGVAAGNYRLIPYEMEKWGEKLTFTLTEDYENAEIQVGEMGTMKVITGKKEQVLNVPLRAIHTAEDKKYVYVVGQGNIREVKWIETGLYGDDCVEVISGLTEGEKVILK